MSETGLLKKIQRTIGLRVFGGRESQPNESLLEMLNYFGDSELNRQCSSKIHWCSNPVGNFRILITLPYVKRLVQKAILNKTLIKQNLPKIRFRQKLSKSILP